MDMPMKDSILDDVMPCGLICYTCTGCNRGAIKEYSGKLLHYLDGYEIFLASNYPDDLEKYNAGINMLKFFAHQSCPGCRYEEHQCTHENCVIRACTKSRGYDFCAECHEFPCEKVNEGSRFVNLWKTSTSRIREVGVEKFFDEEKETPNYLRFKDGKTDGAI